MGWYPDRSHARDAVAYGGGMLAAIAGILLLFFVADLLFVGLLIWILPCLRPYPVDLMYFGFAAMVVGVFWQGLR